MTKILTAILLVIVVAAVGVLLWRTNRGAAPAPAPEKNIAPGRTIADVVKSVSPGRIETADGWSLEVAEATPIVHRVYMDPKDFNKELEAFMDKQAAGEAAGKPPVPYKDEELSFSEIRPGYRLSVIVDAGTEKGEVSSKHVRTIMVVPSALPAQPSKTLAYAATGDVHMALGMVKEKQDGTLVLNTGWTIPIPATAKVMKRVYDNNNPKSRTSFHDEKFDTADIKIADFVAVGFTEALKTGQVPSDKVTQVTVVVPARTSPQTPPQ